MIIKGGNVSPDLTLDYSIDRNKSSKRRRSTTRPARYQWRWHENRVGDRYTHPEALAVLGSIVANFIDRYVAQ